MSPYLQQARLALSPHLVPLVQRDLGFPLGRLVRGLLWVLEALLIQHRLVFHWVLPNLVGRRVLTVPGFQNFLKTRQENS